MTPLEIFEYKLRWRKNTAFFTTLDIDFEYSAKMWCRANLERHQWDFSKFTDFYEDTFHFETEEFLQRFKTEFIDESTKTSRRYS